MQYLHGWLGQGGASKGQAWGRAVSLALCSKPERCLSRLVLTALLDESKTCPQPLRQACVAQQQAALGRRDSVRDLQPSTVCKHLSRTALSALLSWGWTSMPEACLPQYVCRDLGMRADQLWPMCKHGEAQVQEAVEGHCAGLHEHRALD